jgi:integrase
MRTVDGERIRSNVPLETKNKSAANIKLRRLLGNDAPDEVLKKEAEREETFAEACKRVVEQQGREGMRTWKERLARIERYALPELGKIAPSNINTGMIKKMLAAAGEVLAKESVGHLRTDMSTVFQQLWEDDLIPTTPLGRGKLKLPKNLKTDSRERLILSDDEFVRLVDYALASKERYTLGLMCLASRTFGGQRTSDLHAWDWSHVDTKTWATAKVYRPKTERNDDGTPAHESTLTEIEIPEALLGPLKSYWKFKGSPIFGAVFPTVNGEQAGERQSKRSHVRELRAALWEAGVCRPMAATPEASHALESRRELALKARVALAAAQGDPGAKGTVRALRAAVRAAESDAKKYCALQTDTEHYRRPDFHSFRRAYVTAAYASGLSTEEAKRAAGHLDTRTSAKYNKASQRLGPVVQPPAMIPKRSGEKNASLFSPWSMAKISVPEGAEFQNPAFFTGDPNENRTRVIGVRGRRPNR